MKIFKKKIVIIIIMFVVLLLVFIKKKEENISKSDANSIVSEDLKIKGDEKKIKQEQIEEAEKKVEQKQDINSITILVNKDHPVPMDLKIQTTTICDIPVDVRIAEHVQEVIQAAYNENINLGICSGYRDLNFQKMLYDKEVKKFKDFGMNEKDAREAASKNVAKPGESEHQCGLAVDFYAYSDKNANLDDRFENTPEGKFVKKFAPDYGFILRYPKGKEDETKYSYEPWHFRYVGVPIAKKVTNSGLTYEKYYEKYLRKKGN